MVFSHKLFFYYTDFFQGYPIWLSTKENQEMLEELVSTPMLGLDLTVAYIIWMDACADAELGDVSFASVFCF